MSAPSKEEVLGLNPQIDRVQLAEYLDYLRRLREAGVDITPRYRLAPALGGVSHLSAPPRLLAQGRPLPR